jgi:hypothetical protein
MDSYANSATGPGIVWGLPATILWGLLVAVVFVFAHVFGLGLYIGLIEPAVDESRVEQLMTEYQFHGLAISFGMFFALALCLPLVLAAIKLKKGANLRRYLGLRLFTARSFGFWFLIIFGYLLAYDGLAYLLGRAIVPDFSIAIYVSANGSWVLWLAIVLAAPLLEEVLFRGFLFSGLASSITGPVGAVFITSAIWAVIHNQYDYFWMFSIFLIGLALGTVRYKTGSLVLTFVLHALINLGAMTVTAIAVA